jgi:two-component system sensor histidine kinase SenX3
VFAVAALVAIAALLVGAALGAWLARRPGKPASPGESVARNGDPRADLSLAQLVVNALDEGVIVLDRDERAVFVNPAARGMGVVSREQLAFPALEELVRRVLRTGNAVRTSVDLPVGRLGREPIALAVKAVPLGSGRGEQVRAVCLALADETEQRRLEAVRRDFVANVSHELKTPVGALTLLAEAVQDAADDPEAVARFAGRIQREGGRLAKLVGELMELSRVQGADPMPGAAEVEVRAVVDEALRRTGLAAEQAGIAVNAVCGPDLVVRGNEAQLAAALANLIDNAIAYSGSGTRVAVSARPAIDETDGPTVEITVTDQGIGIAEGDRDRIFERFYRVDPARSRATGGTGLGLAIVKNIVTNHSGSVRVWSAPGAGSTFTIRLPRVHSDQARSTAIDDDAGARPHHAPATPSRHGQEGNARQMNTASGSASVT